MKTTRVRQHKRRTRSGTTKVVKHERTSARKNISKYDSYYQLDGDAGGVGLGNTLWDIKNVIRKEEKISETVAQQRIINWYNESSKFENIPKIGSHRNSYFLFYHWKKEFMKKMREKR